MIEDAVRAAEQLADAGRGLAILLRSDKQEFTTLAIRLQDLVVQAAEAMQTLGPALQAYSAEIIAREQTRIFKAQRN